MIRVVTEATLNYKVGAGVGLGSPTFVWFAEKMQWFDGNLTNIVAYAGLALTITMLIGHWCNNIRENKRLNAELEESKLRAELLKLQIEEKKDKDEV